MFRVIGRRKRRAADGPLTSGSFARTFISGTRATGGLALARRALRVPFLRGTPRVVSDESVVHQIRVAALVVAAANVLNMLEQDKHSMIADPCPEAA
jgi:hypothetical protein